MLDNIYERNWWILDNTDENHWLINDDNIDESNWLMTDDNIDERHWLMDIDNIDESLINTWW